MAVTLSLHLVLFAIITLLRLSRIFKDTFVQPKHICHINYLIHWYHNNVKSFIPDFANRVCLLFCQGLSLSGLEKQEIQEQAVSLMMSKYPNCSNKYHMCCDTVGAITTSSDKGSLINLIIITITIEIHCCKNLVKLKRVSNENKEKQAIIVKKATARTDQPSVHVVRSAVLAVVFLKKIYTFLTSNWLWSFFMQCWERLILHGFLLWSWTLTLCYYCYYCYYYYYYYNYVNYSGMVWWCCLYTVKRHELRIWALYTGK